MIIRSKAKPEKVSSAGRLSCFRISFELREGFEVVDVESKEEDLADITRAAAPESPGSTAVTSLASTQ